MLKAERRLTQILMRKNKRGFPTDNYTDAKVIGVGIHGKIPIEAKPVFYITAYQ
jgi:hypothetical protein